MYTINEFLEQDIKIDEKSKRNILTLNDLGLDNSINVQKETEHALRSKRGTFILQTREILPNAIFISDDRLLSLCIKYDLYVRVAERYTGTVPQEIIDKIDTKMIGEKIPSKMHIAAPGEYLKEKGEGPFSAGCVSRTKIRLCRKMV